MLLFDVFIEGRAAYHTDPVVAGGGSETYHTVPVVGGGNSEQVELRLSLIERGLLGG